MRKLAAAVVFTVVSVGVTAGVAGAAPGPDVEQVNQQEVHYTVAREGASAVLDTTDGKFVVDGNQLELRDSTGGVAAELPLTYRMDNVAFPIAATIDGTKATLTPQLTEGTQVADPVSQMSNVPMSSVLKPVDESFSPRDQQALSAFGSRATISSFTSAVLGAIVGGVAGCLIGAGLGAAAGGAVTFLLAALPAGIAGCLAGAAIAAPVGAVGGLILVGGPLLAFAAFQYFSTILAPCTTPGAFCTNPQFPPAPAPK
ncbi:hypothetical protein [Nocardia sp. NPDC051570]|uniref:hypothetical protein n=1 Tax=Nocardia sp. NPDC051570 TaxID=3364324 RepID=UPI003796781A